MRVRVQAAVDSDAPRLELQDRGVSLAFLAEISGDPAIRALTPGELVHGTDTGGQWERYNPSTDPLSVRALTERTGLSL
jgi:hypothetical protein